MKRYFCGVDVGLKGAVAIIDSESDTALTYDMPDKENFRELERIFTAIPNNECIIGIEKQNPFPGQGVVSVYSLGWQVGYFNALLDYLKIPYEEIRSQVWMAYFGLQGKKHIDGKKKLYSVAKRLYPKVGFQGPKGALKDGRVDSVLLAHYVKLKHGGSNAVNRQAQPNGSKTA